MRILLSLSLSLLVVIFIDILKRERILENKVLEIPEQSSIFTLK